jgi:hypothetical protein
VNFYVDTNVSSGLRYILPKQWYLPASPHSIANHNTKIGNVDSSLSRLTVSETYKYEKMWLVLEIQK